MDESIKSFLKNELLLELQLKDEYKFWKELTFSKDNSELIAAIDSLPQFNSTERLVEKSKIIVKTDELSSTEFLDYFWDIRKEYLVRQYSQTNAYMDYNKSQIELLNKIISLAD